LFVGLPWMIFHYITKWKMAATLTGADERLLDEMHDIARRLDDRLITVERIMTADNPNWRALADVPCAEPIEDKSDSVRRIK
ncbi:MAG: phage shock protein, partial [Sphingomonadales bacterium]|nr:phage shock protein [Sphingomonadales bacterium]